MDVVVTGIGPLLPDCGHDAVPLVRRAEAA